MEKKIYYPLSLVERQKRVKKVTKAFCTKCDKKALAGFDDPCWNCPLRWIQNEINGLNT